MNASSNGLLQPPRPATLSFFPQHRFDDDVTANKYQHQYHFEEQPGQGSSIVIVMRELEHVIQTKQLNPQSYNANHPSHTSSPFSGLVMKKGRMYDLSGSHCSFGD